MTRPLVNDKRADRVTGERQRFSSAILPAWARKTRRSPGCCRWSNPGRRPSLKQPKDLDPQVLTITPRDRAESSAALKMLRIADFVPVLNPLVPQVEWTPNAQVCAHDVATPDTFMQCREEVEIVSRAAPDFMESWCGRDRVGTGRENSSQRIDDAYDVG
jgi:hypothetical protein